MDLSDNGDLEEFLLFVKIFKMTLEASGTLAFNAKLHYLLNLFCGKAQYKL